MEKFKKIAGGVIVAILIIVFAAGWIQDAYTFFWSRTWKVCGFDGVYTCQDGNNTIVAIFDGNEMVLYLMDGIYSSRTSYEYSGTYYNKGFFDRFLTQEERWVEIPDADKAGEFYAECNTSVSSSAWGEFEFLDEDEIEMLEEEKDTRYSRTFYFAVYGDNLKLIMQEGEESIAVTMKKERVLTGDAVDTVEHLDTLWEYEFG